MQAQSRESKNASPRFAGIYAEIRPHAIGRFGAGSETKRVPRIVRCFEVWASPDLGQVNRFRKAVYQISIDKNGGLEIDILLGAFHYYRCRLYRCHHAFVGRGYLAFWKAR